MAYFAVRRTLPDKPPTLYVDALDEDGARAAVAEFWTTGEHYAITPIHQHNIPTVVFTAERTHTFATGTVHVWGDKARPSE